MAGRNYLPNDNFNNDENDHDENSYTGDLDDISIIENDEEFENFLRTSFVKKPQRHEKENILSNLPVGRNTGRVRPHTCRPVTNSHSFRRTPRNGIVAAQNGRFETRATNRQWVYTGNKISQSLDMTYTGRITESSDKLNLRNKRPQSSVKTEILNINNSLSGNSMETAIYRYNQETNFKTRQNENIKDIEGLPDLNRFSGESKTFAMIPRRKTLLLEPLHGETNTRNTRVKDSAKGQNRAWLPPLLSNSLGNDPRGRVEFWRFHQTNPTCIVGKESCLKDVIDALKLTLMWVGDVALYKGSSLVEASKQTATLEETLGDVIYPVKLVTVQAPLKRIPPVEFHTREPDVMNPFLDDEEIRVKMSCGHATSPDNLYAFCKNVLDKRDLAFLCPAEGCGKEWSFLELQQKACLTCDERNLFEHVLSNTFLEDEINVHKCPACNEYIEADSTKKWFACVYCQKRKKKSKYCRTCLKLWRESDTGDCCRKKCRLNRKRISSILQNCEWKEIDGLSSPSTRACPSCLFLIHHDKNCKRMKCSICKTDFCFVCLAIKPKGGDYTTKGATVSFRTAKLLLFRK